jgi:hypothetical protein
MTSLPAKVNFGSIPVGHTKEIWVDIVNRGNQSEVMSGAATYGAGFHARYGIPRGLTVNRTEDLTVPITFTPHRAGPFSGRYKVQWADATGSHTLAVPISGTGVG